MTSVRLEKDTTSKFYHCHFLKSKHAAISIEDCTTLIDSCLFYENSLTAIEIRNSIGKLEDSKSSEPVDVKENKNKSVVIQNCKIIENEGGGIEITDVKILFFCKFLYFIFLNKFIIRNNAQSSKTT